jgi:hypothetical protein
MRDEILKGLAEKATPGPWKADEAQASIICEDGPIADIVVSADDADFIAAACNETPKLLARIAALRRALAIYSSNQIYAAHMGAPNATVDYIPAAEALAADDEAQS